MKKNVVLVLFVILVISLPILGYTINNQRNASINDILKRGNKELSNIEKRLDRQSKEIEKKVKEINHDVNVKKKTINSNSKSVSVRSKNNGENKSILVNIRDNEKTDKYVINLVWEEDGWIVQNNEELEKLKEEEIDVYNNVKETISNIKTKNFSISYNYNAYHEEN